MAVVGRRRSRDLGIRVGGTNLAVGRTIGMEANRQNCWESRHLVEKKGPLKVNRGLSSSFEQVSGQKPQD
jgi:hypothetical protein